MELFRYFLSVCTFAVFAQQDLTAISASQSAVTQPTVAKQDAESSNQKSNSNENKQDSRDPVHELVAAVSLGYSNLLKMHSAKVELPSLEAGKKYRVTVAVSNPSEQEISFYGVELQCTCLKIDVKSQVIPPEGVGEFVFLIDVPKHSHKANTTYQARFMERGKTMPTMQLTLSFEVNNMFFVSHQMVSLELSPSQSDSVSMVPVLLVAPVTFEQLELVVSTNLRDLDIKLVNTSEGVFIRSMVNLQNLSDGAISGEVAVRRKGTEDAVGFLLAARMRSSLEVSPSTLRFRPGEGRRSSRYVSKAILRVARGVEESENERELEPEVRLEIEGKPTPVEVKRLGDSDVYRVNIVADLAEGFTGSEPVEIKWSLSYGEEKREISSHAYFSN